MRAFTLLDFSSSSFCLLQASSLHSGNTWLVNTRFLPSGEKISPSASVERFVNCLEPDPSEFISQICDDPPRSETYAIVLESGDHRGRSFDSPSLVMRR